MSDLTSIFRKNLVRLIYRTILTVALIYCHVLIQSA